MSAGRCGTRLVVHVRDHEHIAGRGVGRQTGDEAGGIKSWAECQPFLKVIGLGWFRHGGNFRESLSARAVNDQAPAPWRGNGSVRQDYHETRR